MKAKDLLNKLVCLTAEQLDYEVVCHTNTELEEFLSGCFVDDEDKEIYLV